MTLLQSRDQKKTRVRRIRLPALLRRTLGALFFGIVLTGTHANYTISSEQAERPKPCQYEQSVELFGQQSRAKTGGAQHSALAKILPHNGTQQSWLLSEDRSMSDTKH